MLLNTGDLVKMRKPHPCGSDLWTVTYVGADIKIRCEKCDYCKTTKVLTEPEVYEMKEAQ